MDRKTIVVMEGDQTGQELLEASLRVLDPGVTGLDLDFKRYDLSLENLRTTRLSSTASRPPTSAGPSAPRSSPTR